MCTYLLPHTGTVFENLNLLGYYAASSGKKNYHFSPCNDPEERASQLLRGGSLESARYHIYFILCIIFRQI